MEKFKFDGKQMRLCKSMYANNGALYLGVDYKSSPYCDITINLTGYDLEDGNVFLNGDLTDDNIEDLKRAGIINDIVDTVQYNYGRYKVAEINLENIEKYSA